MMFTRACSAVFKRPPAQKRKTKPRPLTPMQLAAKVLNAEKRSRRPTIDWSLYPLGELPDPDVAKLAGVSKQSVFRARKALGIAAYREEPK